MCPSRKEKKVTRFRLREVDESDDSELYRPWLGFIPSAETILKRSDLILYFVLKRLLWMLFGDCDESGSWRWSYLGIPSSI